MPRHQRENLLPAVAVHARRLALTVLLTTLTGAAVWCPTAAQAKGWGDDKEDAEFAEVVIGNRNSSRHGSGWFRNGNGKFNRSWSASHSPTDLRGTQIVANTNISGNTTTQVGYCKKKHFCKIRQKLRAPGHRW